MLAGTAVLAMGAACLVLFFMYGDPTGAGSSSTTTTFGLGLACGVFLAEGLRVIRGSRSRSRRSSDDALSRARRYRDLP